MSAGSAETCSRLELKRLARFHENWKATVLFEGRDVEKGYWGKEKGAVQVFRKLEKSVAPDRDLWLVVTGQHRNEKNTTVLIFFFPLAKCIQLKGLHFILRLWGFCFVL